MNRLPDSLVFEKEKIVSVRLPPSQKMLQYVYAPDDARNLNSEIARPPVLAVSEKAKRNNASSIRT